MTENGIGVREDVSVAKVDDAYRIAFMNDHINAIFNAIDAGCDVRGYYAWSPSTFTLGNGVEKRYGLVAVDFENNQIRKPKASYYWFKEMIESQGKLIKRREF